MMILRIRNSIKFSWSFTYVFLIKHGSYWQNIANFMELKHLKKKWWWLWKQLCNIFLHISRTTTIGICHHDIENTCAFPQFSCLMHWGSVTHICVSRLSSIGANNGLSPGWRQAIIWTSAGILLIGSLETNFSEISFEIHTFSFTKRHLKMSSGK